MNCRIDIKGLSDGEHDYRFDIDGSFFEAYESDIVSDAALVADALISKREGRTSLDLGISGSVTVKCDRCLADLTLPIEVKVHFPVLFSSAEEDGEAGENDEILTVDRSKNHIDLTQIIYDYVNLNIPIRKVHPDGECDPVMMEKMKDILK